MAIVLNDGSLDKQIAPGVTRRIANLESLMVAVLHFTNGPLAEPDPPHEHPHEQITFVAEGELYVFIAGVKTHLKQGDLFTVPGGIPHCIQPLSAHVQLIDTFSPIRQEFL
jgi:mannose-6-phosphate isomerase-like protein (cupin superfamily)